MHQKTTRQTSPRAAALHGYSNRLQRYRLEAGRAAEGSGEVGPRVSCCPPSIVLGAGDGAEDVGTKVLSGYSSLGSDFYADRCFCTWSRFTREPLMDRWL